MKKKDIPAIFTDLSFPITTHTTAVISYFHPIVSHFTQRTANSIPSSRIYNQIFLLSNVFRPKYDTICPSYYQFWFLLYQFCFLHNQFCPYCSQFWFIGYQFLSPTQPILSLIVIILVCVLPILPLI